MSREQDVKIAEWLGWKPIAGDWREVIYDDHNGLCTGLLNWTTSDSDAIQLLPVLVSRGYGVLLQDDCCNRWEFKIWTDVEDNVTVESIEKPSISEAISSAVSELIDKERGGE